MAAQDGEERLDIAGHRRPDGGREHVLVLAADPEAELLDEVIPVEQLDRVGEAAFPDPADGRGTVGDEEDALRLVDPEGGAGRGEALRERRPAPGGTHEVTVDEGTAIASGPLAAREDETELDLHVRARATVVDHRAVGADPDVAGHAPAAGPLGMGAQERLGPCRGRGLDAGALLGDPGVEPTVADADGAQLVERPGRLRIATAR